MNMKILWMISVLGMGLVFGCQTKSTLSAGQEAISEVNPAGETNPLPNLIEIDKNRAK